MGQFTFLRSVLISGAGAQDRDETVFGHKPFAVLADYRSRRGIAVLRYDDRGFGASTGDHGRATWADFAADASPTSRSPRRIMCCRSARHLARALLLETMPARSHASQLWRWWPVLLALAPAPTAVAQSGVARVNGENLYYEVSGEGPPLVLIHGWSLNLRMWDQQVAALSQRFRVIRYDRRGFGKSSGSEDITWDAEDLGALLDRLGATKVHVLGMSQGARVALQFARRYPHRVSSLILHGAPAPDGFGLPWTGADRPRFDEWATIAREQGLDAFRAAWTAHPLMAIPAGRPEARARLTELLATYRGGRFLSPTPPSGPVAAITMADLPRIRIPTLVLVGEGEVPFLQIVARTLAYYIPGARLAVIPGGAHMVNLVEPDRYNSLVLEFLEGVDRRSE